MTKRCHKVWQNSVTACHKMGKVLAKRWHQRGQALSRLVIKVGKALAKRWHQMGKALSWLVTVCPNFRLIARCPPASKMSRSNAHRIHAAAILHCKR
ncbi:hypothetical protein BN873_p70005 [Candidatus Competibacter denitrificans Run_A_D11]|uniref:Uncharacterized protein n=1 Tax=Candidatus Competibacter denitrificans Run_A_D11 TaxID=1400863 RepID=W6MAH7_9GAMM|nr:hypothetical protein BN873_p70005 [Candidatus Competibacter denitrificans Run_A_D11]